MGKFVRVKVQARVLRTIDKVGGLDEYLLGDKAARIKELGTAGWGMRWKLMQTKAVQERFRQEKIAMGMEVPSKEELKEEEEAKAAKKLQKTKLLEEARKSSVEAKKRRVEQSRRDKLRASKGEASEEEVLIEGVERLQDKGV